jgi:RNA polymerase sigma-70 factor (ECF subfamily)
MDKQTVLHLVQQSAGGNHTAFGLLVEQHQHFAYSVAFRLLYNEYETEEVVQEAFIKVWKHIKDYKEGTRFSTWLYKIVVNLCYDRMKANRVRNKYENHAVDNDFLNKISAEGDAECELSNREQAIIIRTLCVKLTPKQKVVFVLSELEDLTAGEISFITGLTPGQIKSNLYCARNEIRSMLMLIDKTKSSHAI